MSFFQFGNDHLEFKKSLALKIKSKEGILKDWCQEIEKKYPSPFYTSIDVRDSGIKIAPVDSNLYPAGFNNICPDDLRTSPQVIKQTLDRFESSQLQKPIRKIAILPEFNTKNKFYIENLYFLRNLIKDAGYEVEIAWIDSILQTPETLESDSGQILKPSAFDTNSLQTNSSHSDKKPVKLKNGFEPDLILINNDFSGGLPPELSQIKQPMIPAPGLGWHTRKKSTHFDYYNLLVREFCRLTEIDPFIFSIRTTAVNDVYFNDLEGVEKVYLKTKQMLEDLKEEYARKKVIYDPFVFIKNNAGTYGMGIMVVKDAEELLHLNRRTKNKMSVGKNNRDIDSVCIQEGIPTTTLIDRLASEPVIYLSGGELIGGFLRTNPERGIDDNLNSQGMVFKKLCMADLKEETEDLEGAPPYLELVYGSVAKLSSLAAGMELKSLL